MDANHKLVMLTPSRRGVGIDYYCVWRDRRVRSTWRGSIEWLVTYFQRKGYTVKVKGKR